MIRIIINKKRLWLQNGERDIKGYIPTEPDQIIRLLIYFPFFVKM